MIDNPKPFVVAGGIVRNRAWCLPRHLSLVALNRPAAMFYLWGDCKDATGEILTYGVARSEHGAAIFPEYVADSGESGHWMGVSLRQMRHDTGEPSWTRDGKWGPRYKSAHMAAERNLWAQEALTRWPQATHLWVVDSDVLPEPDVLEKLLALKAPVAGAWVPGCTPAAGWDAIMGRAARTGAEDRFRLPFLATMLGGCYLVERRVFYPDPASAAPLGPWREHPQGEDGGFGDAMREMGLVMWAEPGARCAHIMERDR